MPAITYPFSILNTLRPTGGPRSVLEKGWRVAQSAFVAHYQRFAFLLAVLLLVGCGKNPPQPANVGAPPPFSPGDPLHFEKPLPKLTTTKLWLGPKEITAELAITPQELATGMMFRREMGENEGMLFIFGQPARLAFYMKNTYIPLSCAYIDPEGAIVEIHDLEPLNEVPVEARSDKIQFVLEVKRGWFERNGLKTGMIVRTEHGSLQDTFFKRKREQ